MDGSAETPPGSAPGLCIGRKDFRHIDPRFCITAALVALTLLHAAQSEVYEDCGGNLTGQGGQIVSPHYPDLYPRNSLCEWTLTGLPGDVIRVTFSHFDLEDTFWCHKDALEFRDGANGAASLLSRVCGDILPSDITSTTRIVHIRFITDLENSGTGFNITWNSVSNTDPGANGTSCSQQCSSTSDVDICKRGDGACICKAAWEGTYSGISVKECLNYSSCPDNQKICFNQDGGFSCQGEEECKETCCQKDVNYKVYFIVVTSVMSIVVVVLIMVLIRFCRRRRTTDNANITTQARETDRTAVSQEGGSQTPAGGQENLAPHTTGSFAETRL